MKKIFLGLALVLTFAACDESTDTTGQVTFFLQPVFNGSEILPDEVIQTTTDRNFSLKEMRLYITDLYLINEADERIRVNDISLIDWPTINNITAEVPIDNYKGIEFYVGLDSATNASNPIDFESSHPLSADQEMHWGMIKYRFISMVGSVDTSAAGNLTPANVIQYHLGRDELYSAVAINDNFNVAGSLQNFAIPFELNKMFDGTAGTIDIAVHRTNHSGVPDMDKATIIMANFVEALETFE
jgi:hypothetical protein